MARLTQGSSKVIQEVSSKNGIFAVRGVAALLVLFLHISSLLIPQQVWIDKTGPMKSITPWLFRGEVGVGVFIFLSGFLLTLKPLTPDENGQNSIYDVFLEFTQSMASY